MNSWVSSVMTCRARTCTAVAPVAEGDACLVEGDQPPVRERDPMRVAREIGQHCFGSGKGCLGIDLPPLLSDRRDMANECTPVAKAF